MLYNMYKGVGGVECSAQRRSFDIKIHVLWRILV